jgi:hypothetical protein
MLENMLKNCSKDPLINQIARKLQLITSYRAK